MGPGSDLRPSVIHSEQEAQVEASRRYTHRDNSSLGSACSIMILQGGRNGQSPLAICQASLGCRGGNRRGRIEPSSRCQIQRQRRGLHRWPQYQTVSSPFRRQVHLTIKAVWSVPDNGSGVDASYQIIEQVLLISASLLPCNCPVNTNLPHIIYPFHHGGH